MATREHAAEIQIRPIQSEDAGMVAALAAQLGSTRTAIAVSAWIAALRDDKSQAAFVACLGKQVVGWVEVSIQQRIQSMPYALIGGLVVAENIRNQGVGRNLCAQAEQWAWEHGMHKIRVTSRSSRDGAHRFYLRRGYLETKTSIVFEKAASRSSPAIGIGGRVTSPPLPHHRTCGSASGGSKD